MVYEQVYFFKERKECSEEMIRGVNMLDCSGSLTGTYCQTLDQEERIPEVNL